MNRTCENPCPRLGVWVCKSSLYTQLFFFTYILYIPPPPHMTTGAWDASDVFRALVSFLWACSGGWDYNKGRPAFTVMWHIKGHMQTSVFWSQHVTFRLCTQQEQLDLRAHVVRSVWTLLTHFLPLHRLWAQEASVTSWVQEFFLMLSFKLTSVFYLELLHIWPPAATKEAWMSIYCPLSFIYLLCFILLDY